jgi:hypothetical protein
VEGERQGDWKGGNGNCALLGLLRGGYQADQVLS